MRRALAGLGAGWIAIACACARPSPSPPTVAPDEPERTAPTDETAAEPGPAPAIPAETITPVDPQLGSLAWLAGTWVSEGDDPRTVEHWLVPEGGTMLGVNRSVADGRTVFYEYLRIVADDAGVAYLASPEGRAPPTRFDRVEHGQGFVAFENPAHDFPQRIEYRREGATLTMTISGEKDGAARASRWRMQRAPAIP